MPFQDLGKEMKSDILTCVLRGVQKKGPSEMGLRLKIILGLNLLDQYLHKHLPTHPEIE